MRYRLKARNGSDQHKYSLYQGLSHTHKIPPLEGSTERGLRKQSAPHERRGGQLILMHFEPGDTWCTLRSVICLSQRQASLCRRDASCGVQRSLSLTVVPKVGAH